MNIKEIKDHLEKVQSISSKNEKIEYLSQFVGNKDMEKVLNFLYNDMITTGLQLKKLDKEVKGTEQVALFTDLEEVLDFLPLNNTGTDGIIASVQDFIGRFSIAEQPFLKLLVTKSFKSGATANSINKAFGYDFIPQFKVQLAASYEKFADKVNGEFFLTQKLDGHRVVALYEDGRLTFRTRTGKEILGLNEISKTFMSLFEKLEVNNIVFDGEVIINTADTDPTNAFNNTSKVIRSLGDKEDLVFHVFDMVPLNEFRNGKSTQTYRERRIALDAIFESNKDLEHIVLVPTLYSGSDKDKIAEYLKVANEYQWEGLMYNVAEGPNSYYYTKRHKGLLKIKEFFSCDGIVEDVFEGAGKYEGMLGGVLITFEDQIVRIGSGFTDEERVKYWENPELIIGEVCEYQYFEKTENQKGGTDLRFATWKGNIRTDKTIDDVNYE